MNKTLTITAAIVATVVLVASAALFGLGAFAASHRTCGKVDPAQLRAPADPAYAKKLETLARCGY